MSGFNIGIPWAQSAMAAFNIGIPWTQATPLPRVASITPEDRIDRLRTEVDEIEGAVKRYRAQLQAEEEAHLGLSDRILRHRREATERAGGNATPATCKRMLAESGACEMLDFAHQLTDALRFDVVTPRDDAQTAAQREVQTVLSGLEGLVHAAAERRPGKSADAALLADLRAWLACTGDDRFASGVVDETKARVLAGCALDDRRRATKRLVGLLRIADPAAAGTLGRSGGGDADDPTCFGASGDVAAAEALAVAANALVNDALDMRTRVQDLAARSTELSARLAAAAAAPERALCSPVERSELDAQLAYWRLQLRTARVTFAATGGAEAEEAPGATTTTTTGKSVGSGVAGGGATGGGAAAAPAPAGATGGAGTAAAGVRGGRSAAGLLELADGSAADDSPAAGAGRTAAAAGDASAARHTVPSASFFPGRSGVQIAAYRSAASRADVLRGAAEELLVEARRLNAAYEALAERVRGAGSELGLSRLHATDTADVEASLSHIRTLLSNVKVPM